MFQICSCHLISICFRSDKHPHLDWFIYTIWNTIVQKISAAINTITMIIHKLITTGILPDKLKIAKIIPIFKKDDETQFTNYRPISLLPTISKIFERVIFEQLYKFHLLLHNHIALKWWKTLCSFSRTLVIN